MQDGKNIQSMPSKSKKSKPLYEYESTDPRGTVATVT